MARPIGGYVNKASERVVGTTTVIGHRKDAGGMIHSAWKLGKEGKDYKEEWGNAADVGSCTHDMVEHDIHGTPFDSSKYPPAIVSRAETAFVAYLDWRKNTRLEVKATEVSLVCECYQYGGTVDAISMGNQTSLLDWKSGPLYPDHLIQMAAYRHLWECVKGESVTGGVHLLSFSKDSGDFHHSHFSDLSDAWECFVHLRRVYDLDKALAKRIK